MNTADANPFNAWSGTVPNDTLASCANAETLIIGQMPRAPRTVHSYAISRLEPPHLLVLLGAVTVLNVLTVITVLAGLGTAGHADEAAPDHGWTDTQRLRQLTRAENEALVVADTQQLDTLLADDFVASTADGRRMSKRQMIAALGSGDWDVWSIRIVEYSAVDPIKVRLDANDTIATTSYEADTDIGSHPIRYRHDSSGADYHHQLRILHTDTWTRTNGTWRHLRARDRVTG